jgi:GWxTD domain-containing protein
LFRLRPLLFAFLVFLAASPVLHAAVKAKDLPPVYRHWLTQEVNYIIESTERNEFLSLRTDDERDAFMSSFWDSRNPNPGSDTNPYKEEHYRRLAYANENFGNTQRGDGWATDQGMIYITLGPPQSKVTYPNARNVRPLAIWFYQSPSPALTTYFSVVFYKRSIGEDYTIYSPYQDGPAKLVTGLESENDQRRALKQIGDSLGGEVVRTTLSLIPSEPVDTTKYEPSMVSDALLASIRGLADNPLEIARVNLIRQREKVTASIFSTSNTPEATYTVARDATGRATVDYFMRMPQPDTGIAGVRKSGGSGYDMTLQQHIVTEAGRPVYDTISSISAGGLQPNTLDVARHRVFAAEDQLPLEPGKYVVQSTLTNNLNLEAHRITTNIVVPARSKSLTLSTPVAYAGRPGHLEGDRVPFTYAGVRFAPLGVGTVTLHTGDPLQTVFQMWLPPTADG